MNCFMPNHALQIDISSVKNGSADSCRFFFFVKKVGFFRTVDEQRLAMSGLRQTQALIPHLQSRCLPSFLLAVMFSWLAVVEYFFARPDVNLAHVHSSADGLTVTGLQFLCAGYNMLQRLTDKRYNKIKDIKGSRQFKCGAIGFASVFFSDSSPSMSKLSSHTILLSARSLSTSPTDKPEDFTAGEAS